VTISDRRRLLLFAVAGSILFAAVSLPLSLSLFLRWWNSRPVYIRYVAPGDYIYRCRHYSGETLATQLRQDFPRQPFEAALVRPVIDFGRQDSPLEEYAALVGESMRCGWNQLRFRFAGRKYFQPLHVDSSQGLCDVVLNLEGRPQPDDYRSFITVGIAPLTKKTRGWLLNGRKLDSYADLCVALKADYAGCKGIKIGLMNWGGLRLSEYCRLLSAAREKKINFVLLARDPKYAAGSGPLYKRPEVLGPSWPYASFSQMNKVLHAGDEWCRGAGDRLVPTPDASP